MYVSGGREGLMKPFPQRHKKLPLPLLDYNWSLNCKENFDKWLRLQITQSPTT